MKRIALLLCGIVSLLIPLHPVFAADASIRPDDIQQLIARVIGAYGGEKTVEDTAAVHAAGDITAFMRGDRGTYEYYFQRPGKLRVETKYQRSTETRILNNSRGYRGTDTAPLVEVKDQRLLAMVYQYKHIDLLYGLLKGRYTVSRKGRENINGAAAEVLRFTDSEGPSMDAAVDTRTYHIVKVAGYFRMGEAETSLFSEFSDFRKVGDTVLPYRIVNYAGGQKIAETMMKTYVINPVMPGTTFAP